jgi:acyl carrier protein
MTDATRLEDQLKVLLVERLFLKVAPEDIPEEASLMATYGIDSVALFELVVGLEEVFGLALEDEEFRLEHFATVRSIAAFVRSKQGSASA